MYRGINIYKIFGCREGEMVLVTLLLMVAVYGREVVGKSADKPGSIEQLRALGITREQYDQRIEHIKADILRKLGMRAPPNMTGVSRDTIPAAIMDEFWSEQAREEAELEEQRRRKEETQKVVLIGKTPKVLSKMCDGISCLQIAFKIDLTDQVVSSMHIWLYRERHSSAKSDHATVTDAIDSRILARSTSTDIASKRGWVVTDITEEIPKWVRKSHKIDANVRLECSNCRFYNKKRYLPFITIRVRKTRSSRKRRKVPQQRSDCNKEKPCCVQSFQVNLREIGFEQIVLRPKSYDAGICVGSCRAVEHVYNEHDDLMKQLKIYKKPLPKLKQCPKIMLEKNGCFVSEYGSQTFMYRKSDKDVVRSSVVHGMRAIKCECWSNLSNGKTIVKAIL